MESGLITFGGEGVGSGLSYTITFVSQISFTEERTPKDLVSPELRQHFTHIWRKGFKQPSHAEVG